MTKITVIESNLARFGCLTAKPENIELGASKGGGAFGEVFECTKINGSKPPTDMVVKLLFSDNPQAAKLAGLGMETITKLQNKLSDKHDCLPNGLLKEYPALMGVPICCFEGKDHSGKNVKGHISINLASLGMCDFEKMKETPLFDIFRKMPDSNRQLLALQLLKAFALLQDINFIHADLKEDALFVNIHKGTIALIDFDSGTVSEDANDDTTTEGTPTSPWLAPEVVNQNLDNNKKQLKGESIIPIRIDKYCDRWSVMLIVCDLLTTWHPLAFIDAGTLPLKLYLNECKWPEINTVLTKKNFFSINYDVPKHNDFKETFHKHLPPQIYDLVKETIEIGGFNSARRRDFNVWIKKLEVYVSSNSYKPQLVSGLITVPPPSTVTPKSVPPPPPTVTPKPVPPKPPTPTVTPIKISKKWYQKWHYLSLAAVAAFCLIVFAIKHFSPSDGHKNVPGLIIFDPQLLVGDYNVVKLDGTKLTGNRAKITKNTENGYTISRLSDFPTEYYRFNLDGKNVVSPELGNGQIQTDKKLKKLTIVFTDKNNQKWEFSKRYK